MPGAPGRRSFVSSKFTKPSPLQRVIIQTPLKEKNMTIEMRPVVSSNIALLGHDGMTTMRVQFTNGTIYDYSNVPLGVYEEVLTAKSVGGTFSKLIKANPKAYPFVKIS